MKRDLDAKPPTDGEAQPPPPNIQAPRATVYLAETTDDLEPIWWQVKSYLEQHNIDVVPKEYLPRDPLAFRQALDENLGNADLFVQLLSLIPGRKLNDQHTYASAQYACARDESQPVLQWRDQRVSEKEIGDVAEPAHKALLDGADVQAIPLEDFKRNIIEKLQKLRQEEERKAKLKEEAARPEQEGKARKKYIYVLADPKDKPIAKDIFTLLDRKGFEYGFPVTLECEPGVDITPKDIREDLADGMQKAHGALVVYGKSAPTYYRGQLRAVNNYCVLEKKHCDLGLFIGPPPKDILIQEERLHKISGVDGVRDEAFQDFLTAIASAKSAEPSLASH